MHHVLHDLIVNGEATSNLTSLENPDAIDVVLKSSPNTC